MDNLPSIQEIREHALYLGWDDAGITKASIPEEDIHAYKDWLSSNYQGDLHYMENTLRCSPEELLPGAKTAILFITYYKQEQKPFREDAGLIASYARGRDYHNVHRRRLKKFTQWLEKRTGKSNTTKGFSDSVPILEKALAVQAGLGWFGKNTLLIHRKFGTFTLLSGLLTTLEFPTTIANLRLPKCGECRRCLDACPTGALVAPYRLDARRCLSNHLIESKNTLPDTVIEQNPGYAFGCDICQDVCPHNVRKPLALAEEFQEEQGIGAYLDKTVLEKIESKPEVLFGTPLKRRGVKGLKHTAETLLP